jgi:RND family efflux transporter MFP subunit
MPVPTSKNLPILSHWRFLLAALTSLFFMQACVDVNSQQKAAVYLPSASILTIEPALSYTLTRQYVGKVTTKQHTDLGFEYAGKITKVLVDSGDKVKKHQILAQLDTQLLSIKSAEITANIKQIKAQSSLNTANLTRVNALIEKGHTSKQRLDELHAEQQILQGKLQAFNANLQTINYQISKSQLVAPFAAVIGKKLLAQGEVIAARQPAFSLIAQDNSELSLGVPVHLASSLSLGDIFAVTIAEQQHSAQLIAIGRQIDASNRTVNLRLTLVKPTQLFNGQLVRVDIAQVKQAQGFWVPLTALTDGIRGQWNVYLAINQAGDNYQIQSANVKLLHSSKETAFISGLGASQQHIISQGLHRFVPGQIVIKSRIDTSAKDRKQPPSTSPQG